MWQKIALCVACALLLAVYACTDGGLTVSNEAELKRAVQQAQPGQTIVMKNGVWKNIEILLQAEGEEGKPVSLVAESPGGVIISGESNLTLAGNYLVVSGLVFKDGYSPTGSVISFRKSKTEYANHSRVTETVIDRFNKTERFESDIWVTLYGKNNQFDHNHLVGKMNQGVTLAVRLDTEESRENNHRIEYNYFGPRPVLGSNGGETIRVGTSHYSLTDSKTKITHNVFDQCNGEVEIISIKSGANEISNNLFVESAGTLTLRHGNGNIVENNVFLGNNKPHTGGIRVINADHIIRNNYLQGLTGYRFGGGLVVMNGVPNSPINRYHPVKNVVIERNTLVDISAVQLAAGADAERSEAPSDTSFNENLWMATAPMGETFTAYDSLDGITFSNGGVSGLTTSVAINAKETAVSKNAAGFWQADDNSVGAKMDNAPVTLDQVGVAWYPKGDLRPKLNSGKTISVSAQSGMLEAAVANSQPGDVLELAAGEYTVDRVLVVRHPITIKGVAAQQLSDLATKIQFTRNALFQIEDGGSLRITSVVIDGSSADDSAGNAAIRTTRYGMLNNYRLELDRVWVKDLNINHSFSLLKVSMSTMADEISIRNSRVETVTGDVLRLNVETEDLGIFNADYVTLVDNEFSKVDGNIVALYRGGTDESTFGPHLLMQSNRIADSGKGSRNAQKTIALLEGVQVVDILDNSASQSGDFIAHSRVGEPVYWIKNNQLGESKLMVSYKGVPVDVSAEVNERE
ncbi:polysaccharide lyase 6 family protein [Simiduia curdlanivorans]|uniref:Chondroitinase-B domain-containing protein n=1 Tax=Simiduia curdlanivorans TaxID=1492769 RepID=A0ABV8V5G8_9GAMM|nr:polysaccharide lyase 6 family protein [Simiduia curdlanivorans]MDN3638264.1 polysaccharide lyase 6 family protein [Simiduia curdlanivorans]